MVEIIDAFGHVVPKQTVEALPDTAGAKYLREEGLLVDELEGHVSDLDDRGIDKQVICIQPSNMWNPVTPEEALPLVRKANDDIRRMADEYPDRFIPLGTLPFLTDDYLEEFERCIEDLDLHGVQIASNIDGKPLDSEEFYPFYDLVTDYDVPIWIHPTNYAWDDWDNIQEYGLYLVLGWPFETTVAMTRMVFGGIFDRYPGLDVVTHHMGGASSHLAHRISTLYFPNAPDEEGKYDADRAQDIRDTFTNFFVDTARGCAPETLESGHRFYGADQMVFGTDYPFGPNQGRWVLRKEREAVEQMRISEAERRQIFNGNIRSILDL